MAVEIHFITVIVQKDALARLDPGPREEAEALIRDPAAIFREDDHLLATDFMNPNDVGKVISQLREAGLATLVGVAPDQTWGQVAVVDSLYGPTVPAPWLEFRPPFRKPLEPDFGPGTYFITLPPPKTRNEVPRAWLKGRPEGPLAEVPLLRGEARWGGGNNMIVQRLD